MSILNRITALLLTVCMFPAAQGVIRQKTKPEKEIPDMKIETDECGDSMTWEFDNDTGLLTVTGSGDMWNYDDICSPWSNYNDAIREIRFEGDITSIGNYAFTNAMFLQSVTLPDSVKRIGNHAFAQCWDLNTITMPDSLTEIGAYAFRWTDLRTVTMPDTLKTIGESAFCECDYLNTVQLPEGLESIGAECFKDCPSLVDIRIPDHVTEIGEDIFEGCAAWFKAQTEPYIIFGDGFLYRYLGTSPDVRIPDGVKKIGKHCFTKQIYNEFYGFRPDMVRHEQRTDIQSVYMPDSVTDISAYTCSRITALESVRFSNSLNTIPDGFCSGCSALTELTLPDALCCIGESAFSGCTVLEQISIPDTVTEIGANAFTDTAWLNAAGDWVILGDSLLYQYQGNARIVTVPDGVKTICADTFYFKDVVAITLPDSVCKLNTYSFQSNSLMELTLNEGLTAVPEHAIDVSQYFCSVSIPDSVTEIDAQAIQTNSRFTVIGKKGSAAEQFAKGNGYAFSETVLTPDGADMTLHPETDCWSFANSMSAFSGSRYISEEDQELLHSHNLNGTATDEWSGSCFGMSVAVILAKNGFFSAHQLDSTAASLSDIKPEKAVQSMINYYQSTQDSTRFRLYHPYENLPQSVYRMICTAKQVPHGASPFLICFETEAEGRHAVVGYGCETGSWTFSGRDWTNRVLVYDPNQSGFADDRCIYFDAETLDICIPHYSFTFDQNSTANRMYFAVCTDLDVLNAFPYPFAARFGAGDLTTGDAALLQHYLLSGEGLSDAAAGRADISGDGSLSAVDLTLLKQRIRQIS